MIAEHRFKLIARCPVDDAVDHYDVTVRAARMVRADDTVAAADKIGAEAAYQEQITEMLAARFDVEVTTVGTHIVVAYPAPIELYTGALPAAEFVGDRPIPTAPF